MKPPARQGLSGRIENVEIYQLMQMVCMSGKDVRIVVRSEGREGEVIVVSGNVVHAETGSVKGEEAFYNIVSWSHPVCELEPCSGVIYQKTIHKDWQYILLEAARIQDEAKDREKIRVLLVDDSGFFLKQLKRVMEEDDEFIVVGSAKNGSEALLILDNKDVDVITLDIFMPIMSGNTALKHIMLKYSIPVVILSAFPQGTEERLLEFLCLGAVEVLSKPRQNFDTELFWSRFKTILRKAVKARVSHFRIIRPHKEIEVDYGDSININAGIRRLIVIMGSEGSHAEWFRLPLKELVRQGVVIGYSSIHDDIGPIMARLIQSQTGCRVTFHDVEGVKELKIGSVNFLKSSLKWEIIKADDFTMGWGIIGKSGTSGGLVETALSIVRSISETGYNEINLVILSGADEFSKEDVNILTSLGVKFWFPPMDELVCPVMAESILLAVEPERLHNVVITVNDWDSIDMLRFETSSGRK